MEYPKLTSGQSTYLDFVRGFAALAVLFGHAAVMFLDGSLLSHLNIQSFGVFIFFLLSGFLISYSVFRKHHDPHYGFAEYFIDRFCRIYCAFIPALIFVWLVDLQSLAIPFTIAADRLKELKWIVDLQSNSSLVTWVGNLFMLQDFPLFQVARVAGIENQSWFVKSFGSAPPFWTVAIEWWIYMIFGAVTLILMRQDKLKFWMVPLIAFAAIAPVYHFAGGPDQCLSMLWVLGMMACLLFLKLPGWLQLGMQSPDQPSIRRTALLLTGLATIFMVIRLIALRLDDNASFLEFQFGTYLGVAIFAALFVIGDKIEFSGLLRKFSWFIAEYSYSLYLTHSTVLTYLYLRYPGRDTDPAFFWTAIAICNVVAIVFWFLFERHHRKVARLLKTVFIKKKTA